MYHKPKNYEGGDLKGTWDVTYKIDGIRAIATKNGVFSRNGKPLYNLDWLKEKAPIDVEVFYGSWEATVTDVKTKKGADVPSSCVFPLYPVLDSRLYNQSITDPTQRDIEIMLDEDLNLGYEGLVLRQGDKWIKVKETETYDVIILDIIPGTGKYTGMLGSFLTAKGNVGTGFTDEDRRVLNDRELIGVMIEVECQNLTPQGMFRHPRFKRLRFDK